jgi:hypothetical protein
MVVVMVPRTSVGDQDDPSLPGADEHPMSGATVARR